MRLRIPALVILFAAVRIAVPAPAGAATAPVRPAVRSARAALSLRLGWGGTVSVAPETGALRYAGSTARFLTGPDPRDPAAIALDYVRSHLDLFGLDERDLAGLELESRYSSPDGVTHLNWSQVVDGIPSFSSLLFTNVDAEGRIIDVGGSPLSGLSLDDSEAAIGPTAAVRVAAGADGGEAGRQLAPASGPERLARFSGGDSASLVVFPEAAEDHLGWVTVVGGEDGRVYEDVIDAHSGEVLLRSLLTREVSNASVFDDYPGAPSSPTAHTIDLAANTSWLENPSTATRLWGNNARAYADINNNNADDAATEDVGHSSGADWTYPLTQVSSSSGNCDLVTAGCTWDPGSPASTATNRAQATTQAFYLANNYHDWLEQAPIGFTAASHNFQVVNPGGEPGANDPVLVEADDGNAANSGYMNNANMSTPADGSSPRMQMYLFYNGFSTASPAVDGDDDASVVYHEYSHGLTTRLVLNGAGRSLEAHQSGAMGEGWSDWYAMDYLVSHGFETDTVASGEVTVGRYVTGGASDALRYQALDCPVSASSVPCNGSPNAPTGGFTFADMGRIEDFTPGQPVFEVHSDGELWAETLWDLREKLGAETARGLITGALRLAPGNPGMLEMRDAILQADLAATGAHHDQIWEVFAARGMGYGARSLSSSSTHGVASFATPPIAAAATPVVTDPAPLGDGDNSPEPGEAIKLNVQLSNPDTTQLTDVKATLSSSTAGLVVGQPTASYGSIAAGGTALNQNPFAISLPASTPCTATPDLRLEVSSDQGSASLPLENLTLGGGTQAFTNSNDVEIPPTTYWSSPLFSSSIDVSGLPTGAKVSHLHVGLNFTQSEVGVLRVELTSPGGKTVSLVDQPGLEDQTFASPANNLVGVDLFDTAPSSVQEAPAGTNTSPARSGPQRPNEPLALFDGEDPSGTWTLRFGNLYHFNVPSYMTEWSLTLPSPACSTSAPALPVATTGSATVPATNARHLEGQIDPSGAATEFAFQYGTGGSYGQTTNPASAGSGTGPGTVQADLGGLQAGTIYHYRTAAERAGTVISVGEDQTFQTLATPETSIDSGPAAPIASKNASFSFSSEAGADFECSLDGEPFVPCGASGVQKSYSNLPDGPHTFSVRAVAAGPLVDPTPASREFTVDTTPPEAVIGSGPSGFVNAKNASFSFSSEAGTTFECKLDGGGFLPCTSPQSYSGLGDGPHAFAVQAIDQVGNRQASPPSRLFTVDTTPPSVSLTVKAAKRGGKVTASFAASDPSGPVSFTCRIDKSGPRPCTSPKTFSGAKAGRHVVGVSATDSLGNAGSPATKSVKVRKPKKKRRR